MTEYQEMARYFCQLTGTLILFEFKGRNQCPWDDKPHNRYTVTIKRNGEEMTVNFWDSLANTRENKNPTEYDILACLQKYDVGSVQCDDDVEYFFQDYGIKIHSYKDFKKAMETFKAVAKEYADVMRVFGDVIDELREIF